jgi:hypothetical protein
MIIADIEGRPSGLRRCDCAGGLGEKLADNDWRNRHCSCRSSLRVHHPGQQFRSFVFQPRALQAVPDFVITFALNATVEQVQFGFEFGNFIRMSLGSPFGQVTV